MKTLRLIFTFFIASSILISCSDDSNSPQTPNTTRQFGIFKVLDDNTTIEMDGTIGSSALNDFNALVASFPNITKINIKNCDGSSDDTVNLQLSEKVHQKGINIHLMDNGEIASGGVDFFLAGIQRTKGSNTRIGVHAWAAGENTTATDFPVGHANHLPYINYYVSVGFTQQQAEAFYYFTINAAPASGIHWMTAAEIAQYNIVTQ
ncbi:hypothetical protein [Tenacibaculum amylolyticum]|uniref:hypothetical protein n=1 Tax=Tenacibaculum amylolyticum TaxID=104269 RepID=UPI00389429DE